MNKHYEIKKGSRVICNEECKECHTGEVFIVDRVRRSWMQLENMDWNWYPKNRFTDMRNLNRYSANRTIKRKEV